MIIDFQSIVPALDHNNVIYSAIDSTMYNYTTINANSSYSVYDDLWHNDITLATKKNRTQKQDV